MFSVDTASAARVVEPVVGVWVAARRGAGALGALKLSAEAAPSAIPPGWLALHRPVAVSVEVLGKDLDELTNAATVGQLLSAMGIEPDGDDRVAPPLQTPLHPMEVVRFDRVDLRTLTLTSSIGFGVHTTTTSSLPAGQVRITTPGEEGSVRRTYRVRYVDGREVSRTLMAQSVVRASVDEVREVGTAAPTPTPPPTPPPTGGSHTESGQATWYGTGTPGMYAAHPWLPFGTHVTVTDLANGRSVTVVINDRGPFGGRIIDLSPQAFALLAPLPQGVCEVRLTW
ncbi:MAG TPA: G5 domain-containing protein [Actinomycetota bacterium]